jgi:hypothetical protein
VYRIQHFILCAGKETLLKRLASRLAGLTLLPGSRSSLRKFFDRAAVQWLHIR